MLVSAAAVNDHQTAHKRSSLTPYFNHTTTRKTVQLQGASQPGTMPPDPRYKLVLAICPAISTP